MQNTKFTIQTVVLLLLISLVLAACSSADPTPTPTTAPSAEAEPSATAVPPTATAVPPTATPEPDPTAEPETSFSDDFETAACEFDVPPGRDVTCGWLTVPEDRSAGEDSQTLRLHVAIFASDSANPAPDPIVYLEGGPGGDALETVPLIFEDRFSPFLANHDFIMFDQRGTGYSQPSLACPELVDLTFATIEQTLPPEEQVTNALTALTECRQRLEADGVNLAAYNSATNAADLADLRVALGYDEWNVFGISYGTRLAQTLLRDNPTGVRSVILDSSYPLEVNLITDTPANVSRAFDVFFAGCAADSACNEAYPNLETALFDLVASLDADPITVPVIYLFTGEQYDVPVDGTTMLSVMFQSLYSAEIIPALPQLVYDVAAGETGTLSALLSSFLLNSEFSSIGMQYSVQCNEELTFGNPTDAATAAAAYPELEPFFTVSINIGQTAFAVCEDWGAGDAPAIENEPVSSDLPTLILAGEYDPITPPSWGEQIAANFPNSYFYLYPGLGHGASISSDCSLAMTLAFLDNPTSAPDDACIAEMAGPPFSVPGDGQTAITLVPFTSDIMIAEVSGLIPEGWEEAGPGVFARGETALDQTFLLQQAAPGVGAADFLELLSGQLGLEAVPESVGTEMAGDREWTLYQSELQGTAVDIALAADDDFTYVIILGATAADRDFLYDNAFLPALAALTAE